MATQGTSPDPYDQPYPPPDQTQPTQTTLFHGGLTLDHVDASGKRVYKSGDGGFYTDDPDMHSVSGFVPYTAGSGAPTAPPPPGPGAPPPLPTGPAPALSPSVTPGMPTPPPAFHYDPFTPPDPNDLSTDKAFQFENAEGLRAIGARNAALGTLNTGGTLKDYVTFGQNLAHTRYGDLYNRALTTYGTNRGNAVDTYNTNYGTQYKDPWTESMQRAELDQNNNQFNSTQGFNTWLENYKRSVSDPFDQSYKTLSLLKR